MFRLPNNKNLQKIPEQGTIFNFIQVWGCMWVNKLFLGKEIKGSEFLVVGNRCRM